MANPKIDLTGKRFGKLTVLEYYETRRGQAYWKCKCDCGNCKIVRGNHLRTGKVKSCGCLRGEENRRRATHNLSRDRLYNVYHGMIKRCYKPNNGSYSHYGGRGIGICDEWRDKEKGFQTFYAWAIANGYQEDRSIDRIDVNGDYSPNNCRWANAKTQANNRTNTAHIKHNGVFHTPAEWSEITGIERQVILSRYKKGWSEEKIFLKGGDA